MNESPPTERQCITQMWELVKRDLQTAYPTDSGDPDIPHLCKHGVLVSISKAEVFLGYYEDQFRLIERARQDDVKTIIGNAWSLRMGRPMFLKVICFLDDRPKPYVRGFRYGRGKVRNVSLKGVKSHHGQTQ